MQVEDRPVVVKIDLARRARLCRETAAALGLTVKAIERKIETGKWLEGREYHRAPDGTRWIGALETWLAGPAQDRAER